MVSASTENLEKEKDKRTFEDELKRSVILIMNEQIEDQPVSKTADGYKTHMELLIKRLKSNCRQTVYTDCMIGQCLYELKQIYHGKNKLLICATKHLFSIRLTTSTFSLTCLISQQLSIGFRESQYH